MMMARLLIAITCLFFTASLLLLPSSFAQYAVASHNPDIAVQQALTQQQVTTNSVELSKVQTELESTRQVVNTLREDLGTVKGIGIGAAAVIGLLQTLQMILQVRAVKREQ